MRVRGLSSASSCGHEYAQGGLEILACLGDLGLSFTNLESFEDLWLNVARSRPYRAAPCLRLKIERLD